MTIKRTVALEQINILREKEKVLVKEWENNSDQREKTRLQIKDNFNEQMEIILLYPNLNIF